MKKAIRWLVILSVLAGVGYWLRQKYPGSLAFGNAGAKCAPKKPAAPTTAVVGTRDISFAITAAGDIGAVDVVSVRPEVGGLISKLTLDIGDKVKKGDVLFELDDKDLQTGKTSRKTEIAGARLRGRDPAAESGESETEFRPHRGSVQQQAGGSGDLRQCAHRALVPWSQRVPGWRRVRPWGRVPLLEARPPDYYTPRARRCRPGRPTTLV